MMITITFVAALFSLALTLFVLWVNPYRFSNQVFALVLLVQTAWLACVYRAMQIGATASPDNAIGLEWWFRANAAVISFLPATMWLLKCAITANKHEKRKAIFASLPLFALSLVSVGLCSTESFVSKHTSGMLHRGVPYYIYSSIGLGVYAAYVVRILRNLFIFSGIRRMELQFLALNAGTTGLLLLSLNAIGNFLNYRSLNRLSVLLVFTASALTAVALLMHRVFNAQEVFLQLAQRLWFVLILSGGIYGLWSMTGDLFAEPFGLLLSIAVFSPIAVWLDKQSRTWFDLTGEKKLAQLRQCAIEIEHTAPNANHMIQRFEELLTTKFQAGATFLLFNNGPFHGENGVSYAKARAGYRTLCELQWATPESLDRRRATPGTTDLKSFLEENMLGLIIPVPRGHAAPSLLVALTARADERPYTFPEIQRIHNLAELIDSILIRSKLTTQAAIHSRVEHLSMLTRGVVHDLKNLITPISTFLLHTKALFRPTTPEAEVHAAASRAVGTMSDYMRDSLSFLDRLELRLESVMVEDVLRKVCELMSSQAKESGVCVVPTVSEVRTMVCDPGLVQRMLCNLVSNAIDASTTGQTVLLSATDIGMGWVQFEVQDHGCGIPPEYISRVFDPYFTTKNRSQEVKGFGLGLTIAHHIALLHRGTIKIRSTPGQPTVVSVDLPGTQRLAPPANL
jgi:signal transduction histidine kinase